jgi:hypothetical protein
MFCEGLLMDSSLWSFLAESTSSEQNDQYLRFWQYSSSTTKAVVQITSFFGVGLLQIRLFNATHQSVDSVDEIAHKCKASLKLRLVFVIRVVSDQELRVPLKGSVSISHRFICIAENGANLTDLVKSKERNLVRKCHRHNIYIDITDGAVEVWNSIKSMAKKFENFSWELNDLLFFQNSGCRVVGVSAMEGSVCIAFSLLVVTKDAAFLLASYVDKANKAPGGYLVTYETLGFFDKVGISKLILGSSSPGSGSYSFKKKFSFPVCYYVSTTSLFKWVARFRKFCFKVHKISRSAISFKLICFARKFLGILDHG